MVRNQIYRVTSILKVIKTMNDKLYDALVAIGVMDDEPTMINEQIKVAIGSIKLIKKYAMIYDKDELYEDFVNQVKEIL